MEVVSDTVMVRAAALSHIQRLTKVLVWLTFHGVILHYLRDLPNLYEKKDLGPKSCSSSRSGRGGGNDKEKKRENVTFRFT